MVLGGVGLRFGLHREDRDGAVADRLQKLARVRVYLGQKRGCTKVLSLDHQKILFSSTSFGLLLCDFRGFE